MGWLRYLVFVAVGLLVASAMFLGLSAIVSANFDASVRLVERWIVRATCDEYALAGTVRDAEGRPVAFAVVEASFRDERLTTRSNTDGSFVISAAKPICEGRPPRNVQLVVMADEFRPKTTAVPFKAGSIDVTLDARVLRN
jgi:hypothetical protein